MWFSCSWCREIIQETEGMSHCCSMNIIKKDRFYHKDYTKKFKTKKEALNWASSYNEKII